MRKVLFTVALLLTACFVSAQVSVVKEAKSLKSKPEEAAKAIEPALTNPETANDPETWKLAGDFQKAIYDEENMKLYLPGGQADTTKLYNSLAKMYDFYLKCDEIEQAKVQSGELKKPKFRKKNADALKTLRLNLVNGGGDAYNKGDYADALKYFGLFVDVVNEPMFADDDELKADTLNALYACYATLAANMLKDNQAVIKYGNIGKNHKEEGYRALMCLAETYGQKEGGDSAKWLEVIKEGTESFPKQEYFVGNIMDYYIQKGMVDEGLAQINKLLATSETPYYLYVKGILLYEKKQYDDAVAIFNKIISNNGDLVAEAYSKIGDCYFFPAQIIIRCQSWIVAIGSVFRIIYEISIHGLSQSSLSLIGRNSTVSRNTITQPKFQIGKLFYVLQKILFIHTPSQSHRWKDPPLMIFCQYR